MKPSWYVITGLCALIFGANSAFSEYPPDNAAVLYYKAFLTMGKDAETICANVNGTDINEPDNVQKNYLKEHAPTIKLLRDASQIEKCNWGNDYKEGFGLLMPHLQFARNAVRLMILEGRLEAAGGDYKRAFNTLACNYALTRQIGNEGFIGNLVADAAETMTSNQIARQLGKMPENVSVLLQLKSDLQQIEAKSPSLKKAMKLESFMVGECWTGKTITEFVNLENATAPGYILDRFKNADDKFWEANKSYYIKLWNEVNSVLDKPYPQAVAELRRMMSKPKTDVESNPDATFAFIVSTPFDKVYSSFINNRNVFNALQAAVEVYLIKAKTGKLPSELPAGCPVDLFTSKAFLYEIKPREFVLLSQGKDLLKDVIPVYEFQIK